jgi:CubicO group peptidase (beta-lactamase class C family)
MNFNNKIAKRWGFTFFLFTFLVIHLLALSTNNFNATKVELVQRDILAGKYGKVTSIVIYKGNRIIFEKYYGFSQSSTLHPISSVTKSITSLAVGICIDKGYIKSIDTPICSFFPECNSLFKDDTLKNLITIRHLLNQTSGFKWDEWTTHYSYAGNQLIELSHNQKNWTETILNLPMQGNPGNEFTYNSMNSELLKEIVCRTSGADFNDFVNDNIFKPLSISTYYWDTYAGNREPAWGGVALTTRDMAKIGLLSLNGGVFSGKQVVSENWINSSFSPLIKAGKVFYGLHWWASNQPSGELFYYAAGYGDQFVYVIPRINLVVAINAQNFTDHKFEKSPTELIFTILNAYENN